MSDQAEIVARLALSGAFEPGREALGLAVAQYGARAVVDALNSGRGHGLGLRGITKRWEEKDWLARANDEREECQRLSIEVSVPGDRTWPTQLDDLGERAPLALRIQGTADLRTAAARSIAIVGARGATQYGQWVAEDMAAQLAVLGWCVVSGGAFGIDAASHHGALSVGGVSVAVTAAGCDRAVPVSHTSLYSRIYSSGAVVGEVPIGSHPNRHRFLIRNRVIAALVPAVVVVEAAQRSGALATAREALALGRIVGAVPGPVTSALSAGCHSILQNSDVALVTCAADIINEVLGPAPDYRSPPAELTDRQRRLLGLVSPAPRHEQWIGERFAESGYVVNLAEIVSELFLLERLGLVKRVSSGWVEARNGVAQPQLGRGPGVR